MPAICYHAKPMTFDSPQLALLFRALEFAARKHRDQRRKDIDSTPYINHPISVAREMIETAAIDDPDTLCAALLHDTIEDTDTSADELERLFGKTICELVLEVTDDKSLAKAARKQAQIDHAPMLSRPARAIKLADKICNLRDVTASPPPDWSLARRQAYFDWARQVIDGLRGDWPQLEARFDAEYRSRPG